MIARIIFNLTFVLTALTAIVVAMKYGFIYAVYASLLAFAIGIFVTFAIGIWIGVNGEDG